MKYAHDQFVSNVLHFPHLDPCKSDVADSSIAQATSMDPLPEHDLDPSTEHQALKILGNVKD